MVLLVIKFHHDDISISVMLDDNFVINMVFTLGYE